ncbi:MAG: hypothetical protein ACLVAW_19590 [Eisenbergiella massiliensis]
MYINIYQGTDGVFFTIRSLILKLADMGAEDIYKNAVVIGSLGWMNEESTSEASIKIIFKVQYLTLALIIRYFRT